MEEEGAKEKKPDSSESNCWKLYTSDKSYTKMFGILEPDHLCDGSVDHVLVIGTDTPENVCSTSTQYQATCYVTLPANDCHDRISNRVMGVSGVDWIQRIVPRYHPPTPAPTPTPGAGWGGGVYWFIALPADTTMCTQCRTEQWEIKISIYFYGRHRDKKEGD